MPNKDLIVGTTTISGRDVAELKLKLHHLRMSVRTLQAFCDDLGVVIDPLPEPKTRATRSRGDAVVPLNRK